jgi:hypothetical protein
MGLIPFGVSAIITSEELGIDVKCRRTRFLQTGDASVDGSVFQVIIGMEIGDSIVTRDGRRIARTSTNVKGR